MSRAAEAALAALADAGQTLATAESLTGGLIGALLTTVPGASAHYRGGVISYATDLKATLAGVDPELLARAGPVAAVTAEAMAGGVARRCAADWGLAVTGVAGPDRQDGHPVGQVFVAVVRPAGGVAEVRELALAGGRHDIRTATAEHALTLLVQILHSAPRAQA